MYELVILADDFTGALDTGVQFTSRGISTLVTTNTEWGFTNPNKEVQVLVIDMESRHLSPEQAYQKVLSIAIRCKENGVKSIYKKTDSGLRGNIGSELTGLIDAFHNEVLIFIPAYPKTNRVTIKGKHFINGKKVTETEFGRDPFEPVRHDYIQEIIAEQSSVSTICVETKDVKGYDYVSSGNIYILDTETEDDLLMISKTMKSKGSLRLFAGCAGFANYLPEILDLLPNRIQKFQLEQGQMIVSGSVNDITLRQIDYAMVKGIDVIRPLPEQKLAKEINILPFLNEIMKEIRQVYLKKGKVIIDMAGSREMVEATRDYARELGLNQDELRELIATNTGKLVKRLANEELIGTYIIIGGDTLKAVIDQLGYENLQPLAEIESGIVLSKVVGTKKELHIISKSGGFGEDDALLRIENFIAGNSNNLKEYASG